MGKLRNRMPDRIINRAGNLSALDVCHQNIIQCPGNRTRQGVNPVSVHNNHIRFYLLRITCQIHKYNTQVITHVIRHYLFKGNVCIFIAILLHFPVSASVFLQKMHAGNVDKHLIFLLLFFHLLHNRFDFSIVGSGTGNKQYFFPLIHPNFHTPFSL